LPNGTKDAPEDYREADDLEWDFFSRIKVIWIIQSPLKNLTSVFQKYVLLSRQSSMQGRIMPRERKCVYWRHSGRCHRGPRKLRARMTGSASKLGRARASLFARQFLVIVPPQTVTFIATPWLIFRPHRPVNVEAGSTLGGPS